MRRQTSKAYRRKTKIVATIGPASTDEAVLRSLLEGGVEVVRLNFSHGERAEHKLRLETVRHLSREMGRVVAVMQDLQGPKIRTGRLRGGRPVRLREGATFVLGAGAGEGSAAGVSTTYPELPKRLSPGDRVLIDDGLLELEVTATSRGQARCVVVTGGELGENKGINVPGIAVDAPALTKKDEQDLRFALAEGVDMVALSFVRRAEDAARARRIMSQAGRRVPLLAKIEKAQALDRLDGILRAFDGVMVARGDLGVELSPERVPVAQKRIIDRANELGKPVIIATQMLHSMIDNPRPTRAEASDVANAVVDGADAVMLSGETAVGQYPLETVRAMDRIVREAETMAGRGATLPERGRSQAYAVCHAAVHLADQLAAVALAAYTRSGLTAQIISKLHPEAPVFAFCEREAAARVLALWRGVVPIVVEPGSRKRGEPATNFIARELRARRLVDGDRDVIVVGSAPGGPAAHTNFIRVLRLSRVAG